MERQLFEHHPIIGYRFIPGLTARVRSEGGGYLVQANHLGFRCRHAVTEEKPAGKRRLLLFGDSFTAGDGVANEVRYGDLLESRVPDLEVLNFGIPGSGTDQQYLAYREFAQHLQHDLLVIAVLVENIRRVAAHYRYYQNDRGANLVYAKPYYELHGDRVILKNVPVDKSPIPEESLPAEERVRVDRGGRFEPLRLLVNRLGLRDAAQRLTRYQPLPEYGDPETPEWRLLRAILEMWIRESPRPTLVMLMPLYPYVEGTSDPSGYQARFRELEVATGCLLHDPLPDLLLYPPEQRRRFRFERDPHLTPQGHAALAKSLAPVVERLLGHARVEDRAP